MQYMKLDEVERKELASALAGMSNFLYETLGSLTEEESRAPGPGGSFSPVQQVWHLADLEREGFGSRIDRLKTELNPHLPDFDGDAIARARDYQSLPLVEGLRAFAEARIANLVAFQALPAETWFRSGTQDGIGGVSLCDMPVFMHQHDQAHIAEISAWKKFNALRTK